jgi:hypothetical protein
MDSDRGQETPEHDYQFDSASLFSTSYKRKLAEIRSPSLKPVVNIFVRHMGRVGSLGTMPLHAASTSFLLGQIYVQAHTKFGLKARYDNFNVEPRVLKEINRLYDRYIKKVRKDVINAMALAMSASTAVAHDLLVAHNAVGSATFRPNSGMP